MLYCVIQKIIYFYQVYCYLIDFLQDFLCKSSEATCAELNNQILKVALT